VAAFVHDSAVLEDPGLLEAVASAAQLAAANARLRADVQARVEELATSRRRILEARDEGRRRLERRLHDGAEARLGALAVTLRRGQRTATSQQTSDQIVGAQDQLVRTLEELRRLAQGLHPRELSEHGLEGALAALAEDFLLPVQLKVTRTQLPERVAAAACFVCAEALTNSTKHATDRHVAIAVTVSGGRVRVEIADDGVWSRSGPGVGTSRACRPRRGLWRDALGGKRSQARWALATRVSRSWPRRGSPRRTGRPRSSARPAADEGCPCRRGRR
jgi:signal transduction histidine kinase